MPQAGAAGFCFYMHCGWHQFADNDAYAHAVVIVRGVAGRVLDVVSIEVEMEMEEESGVLL